MRVADKMNYEQVNSGLQKNRAELSQLQNQAATQKRINKPSDDPLAATRTLAAKTDISSNQQYLKNVAQAKAFLDFTDQALGELTEVMTRAKELAISQSSDSSANETTRRVVATEIQQLRGQAIQVGNRKMGDRFLFGGYQTTNPPFTPQGDYHGDDGEMKITVDKEAQLSANMPGSKVFLGKNLRGQETPILGRPELDPERANKAQPQIEVRGPATRVNPAVAERPEANDQNQIGASWRSTGVNVFSILSDFEVNLRANSKQGIQDSLEKIDEAIAQVVLARSDVGSRLKTLENANENLSKGIVDSKSLASSLEDVDTFELVSDLNKSETTLKAALSSSSKLIQPSLLEFLR